MTAVFPAVDIVLAPEGEENPRLDTHPHPAWQRFWTNVRLVGMERGQLHRFHRRTLGGRLSCSGEWEQPEWWITPGALIS